MGIRARLSGVENAARRAARRRESARVPAALSEKWRPIPSAADSTWTERIESFRTSVVPWMDTTCRLDGQRILEIGCGPGASTAALAEQGAVVTGLDLGVEHVEQARGHLADMGLESELHVRNATDLEGLPGAFHQVVFWAVVEHMLVPERLDSLAAAWSRLSSGGLLTLVETPNRLWPHDSHTSYMPFFAWLPYELGYRYSAMSPRVGFAELYGDPELTRMEHFLRRGHGVSFHEFDLAIGDHRQLDVVSSMQSYARGRSVCRRVGWKLSSAGRVERVLAGFAPGTDPAWLQPFLYLTIRKA